MEFVLHAVIPVLLAIAAILTLAMLVMQIIFSFKIANVQSSPNLQAAAHFALLVCRCLRIHLFVLFVHPEQ